MKQKKIILIKDTYISRMLFVLAATAVFGAILRPQVFPTLGTAEAVMRQSAEYGLLALGVAVCMMSGGIDLSAVYLANLSSIILGIFLKNQWDGQEAAGSVICAGILIAVITGILGGILNGFLIGKMKLPAMLATLGSGQLFMGISLVITKGKALNGVPSVLNGFANANILGVPALFLLFAASGAILHIIMTYTRFGQEIFLVGTNIKAAVFSGLNEVKITIRTYVISGILAALSGIVILSRNSSAKADFGTSYVLLTILIAVLGGTDPDGGSGSVAAVAVAAVVMQIISSLFNMFGAAINTFYRNIVWGILLVATLIINHYFIRSKRI